MNLLGNAAAFTGKSERELRAEIKHLRKELAGISRSVSDMGHDLYEDVRDEAADTFKHLRKRGRKAARQVRRQTSEAVSVAQDYPMTTIAVVAGIGFLIAAFAAWEWERDN